MPLHICLAGVDFFAALQVFVRVRPINAAEIAEGKGLSLTAREVQAVLLLVSSSVYCSSCRQACAGIMGVQMLMHAFVSAIAEDGYPCTRMWGDRGLALDLKHRSEPYNFKFDAVLPETTTQEEVFERKQQPDMFLMPSTCVEGMMFLLMQ